MTRFIEITYLERVQQPLINTDYVVRLASTGQHTLLRFNGFLEQIHPNFGVQEPYETVRGLLPRVVGAARSI